MAMGFVYVTLAHVFRVCTVFNCYVFCHRASLKHTLKKKNLAFRNIGKIYFPDREISLDLFLDYLFYNLLLNKSFTTGSGTFISPR